MSISISQNYTAIAPGLTAQFSASGGTAPYSYSVGAGGAGGSIGVSNGIYIAPLVMGATPPALFDTITVTDSLGATASALIMVAGPLFLFCDILQSELGLAPGRVFLWDQKVFQPTDSGLYISVGVASCKPFGNTIGAGANGWDTAVQSVNMSATLDIDIMSRGPDARDRKEEVILALNSVYAQSQQEANSFYIGKLPSGSGFANLSAIDGAAIPYRFRISVNLQYAFTKTKAVPYYNTFANASLEKVEP